MYFLAIFVNQTVDFLSHFMKLNSKVQIGDCYLFYEMLKLSPKVQVFFLRIFKTATRCFFTYREVPNRRFVMIFFEAKLKGPNWGFLNFFLGNFETSSKGLRRGFFEHF